LISVSAARRLRLLMNELAKRKMESLRLFEPLPKQEEALRSTAKEKIIRGSNQAGKTLCAAIDVAWKATGTHPYKPNFPREIYLVAKDGKQIGEVWWKKLCRPGAFEIIRDEKTDVWRAYRPWDANDVKRKSERQPAPPLIPERFWDGEPAWEQKNTGIPRLLKLKNGTRIHFFTGNAKPPHGTQITDAYFDEEIGSQAWYSEIAARLLRFDGEFTWSATPQAATEGLLELHLRADDEKIKEQPNVTEHFLHIEANPHIEQAAKDTLLSKLTDPDQKRVRWDGEYAGTILNIYPEWNINTHGVEPFDIPKEWTRYMVVDPGQATMACLFAAVPPPDFGDFVFLYDELYVKPCLNSEMFANRVKGKIQDDHFYEFIIDSHSGRTTEVASGLQIQLQYARALAKENIRSQVTGSDFSWGVDDRDSGNIAVHDWLHIRKDGTTKLRVFKGRLPSFEWEIQRYRRKRDPGTGQITDKVYDRNDHMMDCLRYLRGRDPQWHKPVATTNAPKTNWEKFQAWMASRHQQEDSFINLGPGRGQRLSA
jgi:hypothetical protein